MKTARKIALKAIKGNLCQDLQQVGCEERLPLAKCREILNSGEVKYSDAEVIKIRDYLYQLAAIASQQMDLEGQQAKVISLSEHKNTINEKSDYLCTG